jgi:transcriptional activator of cad operon
VVLDPDAWGAMINIGDLLEISGRDDEALPWFEQAYAAMGRVYDRNPVQVRPWYADLGVLIADRYRVRGALPSAEAWYRRVLAESPLHPAATTGLARLLREGGDAAAAARLCAELKQRSGKSVGCE